jgi:hypothetical protein
MMFAQDHLNELLRSAMSKPTEVLGNRIVRHAKVPKDLVRDSRNLRRRGPRRIRSDLLRAARPFDTPFETTRVASTHRCFPSEMAKRTGRTLVRPLGLLFRPDQEHLVKNGASRNNPPLKNRGQIRCTWQVCVSLSYVSRLVSVRRGFAANSIDCCGASSPTFVRCQSAGRDKPRTEACRRSSKLIGSCQSSNLTASAFLGLS